jgi:transcriptional accessory protein Tex/SPT6
MKLIGIKEAQNLDIYRSENAKIGVVLSKMGLTAESEKYFNDYLDYAENDNSICKHLSLAVYFSFKGDTENALIR